MRITRFLCYFYPEKYPHLQPLQQNDSYSLFDQKTLEKRFDP